MSTEDNGPKINPGDIILWPMLKLDYDTDPGKLAALLPPGIQPGSSSQVHLTIYNFPVPDVPEYGILITVAFSVLGMAVGRIISFIIDSGNLTQIH